MNDGPNLGTPPTGGQPIIINQPPAGQYFTAEQLEAARQQEKDKLYQRIESFKTELDGYKAEVDTYKAEREAAKAEADRLAKEAADAAQREAESKMSVQDLLAAKEAQWNRELAAQKEENEKTRLLMQMERDYLNLQSFIQRRIAEEIASDTIAEEFLDYISGNSEAEVEASITKAKEKTAKIVAVMTGQNPPPARNLPGVSPTGLAPSGPLDNLVGQRQYSLEELKAMGKEDYAKLRIQMGIDRAGNNQGMWNS